MQMEKLLFSETDMKKIFFTLIALFCTVFIFSADADFNDSTFGTELEPSFEAETYAEENFESEPDFLFNERILAILCSILSYSAWSNSQLSANSSSE